MEKYAVILAAGDGTRMHSKKPKPMLEVLFKPMLGWVMDALKDAGIDKTAVIVGQNRAPIEEYLAAREKCTIFVQNERKGTGHAVMQAGEFIKAAAEKNGDILVVCGDAPFIDADTLKNAYARHKDSGADVTVIATKADDPFGYGRVIVENGDFIGIVEEKDCDERQKAIDLINSGVYWFKAEKLPALLASLTDNNANHEYYLTDTAANAESRCVYITENRDFALGANDRAQLARLNGIARERVLCRLMSQGVDIPLADGVIIGSDVIIGEDTTVLPGTVIKGGTVIGCCCEIGPNTLISDCKIGDNVVLNSMQAYDSTVEDNAKIGPFSQLRAGSHIKRGVKIGDFVEIKNSVIGENTCAAHLTYLGDSDVGRGVNFGCGCVTANYDGIDKFRTVIGDHAFIGCNTNLVAPVKIGDNATTGAGSTITKDIPENALAVERAGTRIIENWEKNSRRKKK